jgi:hypothetical protein
LAFILGHIRFAHIANAAQGTFTLSRRLIVGAHLSAGLLAFRNAAFRADLIILVHLTITIIVEAITDLDATGCRRAIAGNVIGSGSRRI